MTREFYPKNEGHGNTSEEEIEDSEVKISDGEIKGAAQEIKKLIESGVEPKDIAIFVKFKTSPRERTFSFKRIS